MSVTPGSEGGQDTRTFPAGLPLIDAEGHEPARSEILIITGMSGAGRTHTAGVLQDWGWYVVDNLPPQMIAPLAGMMTPGGQGVRNLAVVVDVRSREFFQTFADTLSALSQQGFTYRVLFLDASDEVLVRRYEQVRRPHPLQGDGRILDGIAREREVLRVLRERADVYIDTSDFSIYDLATKLGELAPVGSGSELNVSIMSFGFKHGLPLDADFVADVRFLPNPYWVDELRHLTGRDEPVRRYVMSLQPAQDFAEAYVAALKVALDGYVNEHKRYATVAIGCTGGRHRSVVLAEEIALRLREYGQSVRTMHRDIGKD